MRSFFIKSLSKEHKRLGAGERQDFTTPDGFLVLIDKDSHNINTENPYGAYYLLLRKSQKEILEKIKLLRPGMNVDVDVHLD